MCHVLFVDCWLFVVYCLMSLGCWLFIGYLLLHHNGTNLEKTIEQIRPPICPEISPVIIKKRPSFSAVQLTFFALCLSGGFYVDLIKCRVYTDRLKGFSTCVLTINDNFCTQSV